MFISNIGRDEMSEKPTGEQNRKLILEALIEVYSREFEVSRGDVHGLDALQAAKLDRELNLEADALFLDKAIDNIKKKIELMIKKEGNRCKNRLRLDR